VFASPGQHIGQRFAFLDQAHYSMVKTNTFNGRPPAGHLAVEQRNRGFARAIRTFNYSDFKARLS
jgi:carboxynorspermidine decarboxylase